MRSNVITGFLINKRKAAGTKSESFVLCLLYRRQRWPQAKENRFTLGAGKVQGISFPNTLILAQ